MAFLIGIPCLLFGIFSMCALNRLSAWILVGMAVFVMSVGQVILEQSIEINAPECQELHAEQSPKPEPFVVTS